MPKLYRKFDQNDNFIKSDTYENLTKEGYFISKSIEINYKKRQNTNSNNKHSDNYYFTFVINSESGYIYPISPSFYFRCKLSDGTIHKKEISQKIIDNLEFKKLLEYREKARSQVRLLQEVNSFDELTEQLIFKDFIDQKLIVQFRK